MSVTDFWTAEYATKAAEADPLLQSGRGRQFTTVALLHQFRAIARLLGPTRADHVLDLGCGNGLFTIALSGIARSVLGVEPVAELREHATRNCAPLSNVSIARGDATSIPTPDGSCDRVLVFGVLQLIPAADVEYVFAEVRRVLTPNGRVLFGSLLDAGERDKFLGGYLGDVRAAQHLSVEEKEQIIARNAAATWHDPRALAAWWSARGATTWCEPVAPGDPDAGHRFHFVAELRGDAGDA